MWGGARELIFTTHCAQQTYIQKTSTKVVSCILGSLQILTLRDSSTQLTLLQLHKLRIQIRQKPQAKYSLDESMRYEDERAGVKEECEIKYIS